MAYSKLWANAPNNTKKQSVIPTILLINNKTNTFKEIVAAINRLEPIKFSRKFEPDPIKEQVGVLCIGDEHYGTMIDMDSLFGEKVNVYNPDVFKARMEKLMNSIEDVTWYKCSCSSKEWLERAKNVVLTGAIDEWYGYCFGALEYRSLKFETEELQEENHQGNAVVNYTDARVPFTRVIEHKHFTEVKTPTTIITKEYPQKWKIGKERYYPISRKT